MTRFFENTHKSLNLITEEPRNFREFNEIEIMIN